MMRARDAKKGFKGLHHLLGNRCAHRSSPRATLPFSPRSSSDSFVSFLTPSANSSSLFRWHARLPRALSSTASRIVSPPKAEAALPPAHEQILSAGRYSSAVGAQLLLQDIYAARRVAVSRYAAWRARLMMLEMRTRLDSTPAGPMRRDAAHL